MRAANQRSSGRPPTAYSRRSIYAAAGLNLALGAGVLIGCSLVDMKPLLRVMGVVGAAGLICAAIVMLRRTPRK